MEKTLIVGIFLIIITLAMLYGIYHISFLKQIFIPQAAA